MESTQNSLTRTAPQTIIVTHFPHNINPRVKLCWNWSRAQKNNRELNFDTNVHFHFAVNMDDSSTKPREEKPWFLPLGGNKFEQESKFH